MVNYFKKGVGDNPLNQYMNTNNSNSSSPVVIKHLTENNDTGLPSITGNGAVQKYGLRDPAFSRQQHTTYEPQYAYVTILDAEGYQRFGESKIKSFEEKFKKESDLKKQIFLGSMKKSEKYFLAREKIKRSIEAGSPIEQQIKKIQEKRESIYARDVENKTSSFNAGIEKSFIEGKTKTLAEIESARSKFERKEWRQIGTVTQSTIKQDFVLVEPEKVEFVKNPEFGVSKAFIIPSKEEIAQVTLFKGEKVKKETSLLTLLTGQTGTISVPKNEGSFDVLGGIQAVGEFISSTTRKASDIIRSIDVLPESNFFNIFEERYKNMASFTFGFGGGAGELVSSGAYLVKQSPALVGGAVSAAPIIAKRFSEDPYGTASLGVSKIGGFVGGVFSTEYQRFNEDPYYYTGSFVGGLVAGEKISGTIGKVAKTGYGYVITRGKKFIPEEALVSPEVISGAKVFPEVSGRGSGSEVIKSFYKEPYSSALGNKVVYSATDYPFTPFERRIVITAGRGLTKSVDVPGLYTSTRGVSTYFLRQTQNFKQYAISLFPSNPLKSPKILAIYSTPQRVPSIYRRSLEKAQSYFGKEGLIFTTPKGKPGVPYVSPALEFGFKKEAEAVIQVGSNLDRTGLYSVWEKLTGFSKYTKIKGDFVPIYEYVTSGSGKVSGFSRSVGYGGESSLGLSKNAVFSYGRSAFVSSKFISVKSSYVDFGSVKGSYVYYPVEESGESGYSVVKSYKPSIVISRVSITNYKKQYNPIRGAKYSSDFSFSKNSINYSYSPVEYKLPKTRAYKSVSYTPKKFIPNFVPPSYSKKRKIEYYTKPTRGIDFLGKYKAKVKTFRPGNVSNVILPVKTDWLKAFGYGKKKPRIKTIELLPSKRKGSKQVASLLGFSFKESVF